MNMSMRNIILVAKRELGEIIGTKGFLLMLFLPMAMLFLMGALIPLADKMMRKANATRTQSYRIGIIGSTPEIVKAWREKILDRKLANGLPMFELIPLSSLTLPKEALEASAKSKVRGKEWDAYAMIQGDILEQGRCDFNSMRGFDMRLTGDLSRALADVTRKERLKAEGLDPARIDHLTRWINWNEYELSPAPAADGKGGDKSRAGFDKLFIPALVCIMLMFFLTFATTQRMLRTIVEEKTSRVVEVLLSSLSSTELLAGKVFGYYLIGLIQFAVWVGFGLAALYYKQIPIANYVPAGYFFHFLIFLTTGYLFYAAVFAAIGAVVGDETESQQLQGVATIVIVIPLMFNIVLITQPNWWPVRLLSFVPFFSPTVMAVRMVVVSIPWWEMLAIASTTLLFAIAGIGLAARFFRIGVLMTGKRPSLKELWRWCWLREDQSVVENE
ncbi:MAG: ABC transporter permease [Candidatus Omnitrophota bacterium]